MTDFPSSPALYELYSDGYNVYKWDGVAWVIQAAYSSETMLYKGEWYSKEYSRNDVVTYSGNTYVCNELITADAPGTSTAWSAISSAGLTESTADALYIRRDNTARADAITANVEMAVTNYSGAVRHTLTSANGYTSALHFRSASTEERWSYVCGTDFKLRLMHYDAAGVWQRTALECSTYYVATDKNLYVGHNSDTVPTAVGGSAGHTLSATGDAYIFSDLYRPLTIGRPNDGDIVAFLRGRGTQYGSITVSGGTTHYNASSDYRLKENVRDVDGVEERIKALVPHSGNYKTCPDTTVDFFIAHELASVIPWCVTGDKDAVDSDGNMIVQMVDQSKLIPLLTAAVKMLLDRVEQLEAAP